MTYYRHHVFFCTNRRADDADRPSCALCDAEGLRSYAKAQLKARGLSGPGGVRANSAGCLDRCEEGPVLVVYPEGVWYTYLDESDIDEIIERHLVGGEVVERLRLPDQPLNPSLPT